MNHIFPDRGVEQTDTFAFESMASSEPNRLLRHKKKELNMTNNTEKIKGCLVAGAIGDALGYPIEFHPWNIIRSAFGPEGLTDLPGKAYFSDDTQMTLFTCEGLLKGRDQKDDVWYVYEAYLHWLATQGIKVSTWTTSELEKIPALNARRAPGNTCISALSSKKMGTIERPLNNSKGCGGVMRVAPVGTINDYDDYLLKGAEIAAITHGHPGGWIPGGILADMIHRIMTEGKGLVSVVDETISSASEKWKDIPYTEHIISLMRRAIALSEDDLPDVDAIHSLGEGWTGDEALAIAVYSALKYPDDIRKALICAVNHNGDSDSTGSITGNMIGAYLGYEAIPKEWREKIELHDLIVNIAERMT